MTKALKVHLLCTPWSMPIMPSIQVGTLKAFLDQRFQSRIETVAYSPHFAIHYKIAGSQMLSFFEKNRNFKEYGYFALWKGLRSVTADTPIEKKVLLQLKTATEDWIDDELLPELDPDHRHLVGFTLTYDQLYSSLFFIRRILEKRPGLDIQFVFGGYCASLGHVQQELNRLGIRGFLVQGEGEEKLAWIVDTLLKSEPIDFRPRGIELLPLHQDIPERDIALQISDLKMLPLPDYDEFFKKFRAAQKTDLFFARVTQAQKTPSLPLEGSRGCFAKCDFCAENAQWTGFRKMDAKTIFNRTRAIVEKYQCTTVHFLDNVSDTWAEEFSDILDRSTLKLSIFCMELRAHHPEEFWTKLRRSGAHSIQVGIETVAQNLLKQMSKGTHVVQNLAVLKYMGELEIFSQSNLISHHPKSTLADVLESRTVMALVPHFPKLKVVVFELFQGSPIYDALSPEARARLRPIHSLPSAGKFTKDMISYSFHFPKENKIADDLEASWNQFSEWLNKKVYSQPHSLTVRTIAHTPALHLEIDDQRFGRNHQFRLSGDTARCLDICHKINRKSSLLKELHMTDTDLDAVLSDLIQRELVYEKDGYYLSLPLRPKEVLFANLQKKDLREMVLSQTRLASAQLSPL